MVGVLKKQTNLKNTPTKSFFISSSSGAAFWLTPQRRRGCFGQLAMQKGGKESKQHQQVGEVTTLIWAVAAAVGDREGTRSPHQT